MAKKKATPKKKTPPTRKIYRSAVTGRTVTKQYAEAHPKTTERETVPVRKPKKTKA
jgi:hypothetical protein